MQTLLLTLHSIVCVLLVILILLQAGKEGMGVIFGGGNTTLFGSTGAGGILVKLTTLMAIIFVITSLSYTYVTSSHTEKESTILNVQIEQPAAPTATQTDVTAKQADVKEQPAAPTAKQADVKEQPAAPTAKQAEPKQTKQPAAQ